VNPFYFGTRERRLYGVFTPARASKPGTRSVLLCHPWGQEYLRAHRSMRRLAVQLNDAGCDVLRFDYFGSGDSGGETIEGDVDGWCRDIETAIDELKDMTNAKRVALTGLRLGATLAAQVAARRRSEIDRLVLWDPIVSGAAYLREFESSPAGDADDSGRDVLGFTLTATLERELGAIDLVPLVPSLPAPMRVVVSDPGLMPSSWRVALEQHPAGVVPIECVVAEPAWLEHRDSGAGAIPVRVLQRLVECLT
jgi:pimeloyl-ACP methyl ester carboxylesterase